MPMQGIPDMKQPPRGTIIAAVPFPHREDSHLYLVISKAEAASSKGRTEFIRWTYNTLDRSYHYGHYGMTYPDAVYSIAERLKELLPGTRATFSGAAH